MKEFLKKYLTSEELTALEQKYIADRPEEKSLPIHISKARLDEILGKKKAAEDDAAASKAALETTNKEVEARVAKAIKEAVDAAGVEHSKALEAVKQDFATTELIYKARGRNVVAIKALIDTTKKADDEIKRLQKETPYLFEDDIPEGTGKQGDDTSKKQDAQTAQMRAAIGL